MLLARVTLTVLCFLFFVHAAGIGAGAGATSPHDMFSVNEAGAPEGIAGAHGAGAPTSPHMFSEGLVGFARSQSPTHPVSRSRTRTPPPRPVLSTPVGFGQHWGVRPPPTDSVRPPATPALGLGTPTPPAETPRAAPGPRPRYSRAMTPSPRGSGPGGSGLSGDAVGVVVDGRQGAGPGVQWAQVFPGTRPPMSGFPPAPTGGAHPRGNPVGVLCGRFGLFCTALLVPATGFLAAKAWNSWEGNRVWALEKQITSCDRDRAALGAMIQTQRDTEELECAGVSAVWAGITSKLSSGYQIDPSDSRIQALRCQQAQKSRAALEGYAEDQLSGPGELDKEKLKPVCQKQKAGNAGHDLYGVQEPPVKTYVSCQKLSDLQDQICRLKHEGFSNRNGPGMISTEGRVPALTAVLAEQFARSPTVRRTGLGQAVARLLARSWNGEVAAKLDAGLLITEKTVCRTSSGQQGELVPVVSRKWVARALEVMHRKSACGKKESEGTEDRVVALLSGAPVVQKGEKTRAEKDADAAFFNGLAQALLETAGRAFVTDKNRNTVNRV